MTDGGRHETIDAGAKLEDPDGGCEHSPDDEGAASAEAVPIHTGRDTGNDAGFHFRRLTDLNKSPAGRGIGERKPRAATGAGHDRRQRRAPAASLCFLFALAATLCFWPAGWRRAAIIASQAFLSPQCHFMLPLTATLWVKAHSIRLLRPTLPFSCRLRAAGCFLNRSRWLVLLS